MVSATEMICNRTEIRSQIFLLGPADRLIFIEKEARRLCASVS
jgi:hypothetical protein